MITVIIRSHFLEKVSLTIINMTATLAIYPEEGHNISTAVLPKFRQHLFDGVMDGFNVYLTIDSHSYALQTSISVATFTNEKAAIASKAQNLVALGDRAIKSGKKNTVALVFQESDENFDRMMSTQMRLILK